MSQPPPGPSGPPRLPEPSAPDTSRASLQSQPGPPASRSSNEPQASGQNTLPNDRRPEPPKPPTVKQPTGGGAVRGMGEKFQANPETGTSSFNIPIATSPSRG